MEKCIILDMDNTLICFYKQRPYLKEFIEFVFANFKHVALWTAGERVWLNNIYNVILKPLIPEGKNFAFMWSRIDCTSGFVYCPVKNNIERRIFKELKYVYASYNDFLPNNTIIIDDNVVTCCKNLNNSLHIIPFNDEEAEAQCRSLTASPIIMPSLIDYEDNELLKLIIFIRDKILPAEDVRGVPKIYWYKNILNISK